MADNPDVQFKGNFIKKFFSKRAKGGIKWKGKGIQIYEDVLIPHPYDKVEILKEDANITHYEEQLIMAHKELDKVLEEYPVIS